MIDMTGTIPENPSITVDHDVTTMEPFSFKDWMDKHSEEIESKGFKKVFEGNYQFSVSIYLQSAKEIVSTLML